MTIAMNIIHSIQISKPGLLAPAIMYQESSLFGRSQMRSAPKGLSGTSKSEGLKYLGRDVF